MQAVGCRLQFRTFLSLSTFLDHQSEGDLGKGAN
jgi:hypothetical protein